MNARNVNKTSKTLLLDLFIDQFQQRHKQLPKKIIVHPLALAALCVKGEISPRWRGINVFCKDSPINPATTLSPKGIAIILFKGALRAFDID